MKLTTEQLDEIEQTANKATPGPWEIIGGDEYISGPGILAAPDDRGVSADDAQHIATMDPAATLTLVAEVRELRAAVEKARAIHMKSSLRDECLTCTDECSDPASWPCDTVKALGDAS